MDPDLASLRNEYSKNRLDRKTVDKDPLLQFRKWLSEAISAEVNEPSAMTLATSGADGKPSARVVLLKDVNETGLTFFTNYESKKGKQLKDNPQAALVFFWPELERQVRIEGKVKKLPGRESDSYFNTRPEGSRIGAWASRQSNMIPSRDYLREEAEKYARRFENLEIPRPSYWGGYILAPLLIEFWQGRPDRLHDRILYTRHAGNWHLGRLSP